MKILGVHYYSRLGQREIRDGNSITYLFRIFLLLNFSLVFMVVFLLPVLVVVYLCVAVAVVDPVGLGGLACRILVIPLSKELVGLGFEFLGVWGLLADEGGRLEYT